MPRSAHDRGCLTTPRELQKGHRNNYLLPCRGLPMHNHISRARYTLDGDGQDRDMAVFQMQDDVVEVVLLYRGFCRLFRSFAFLYTLNRQICLRVFVQAKQQSLLGIDWNARPMPLCLCASVRLCICASVPLCLCASECNGSLRSRQSDWVPESTTPSQGHIIG